MDDLTISEDKWEPPMGSWQRMPLCNGRVELYRAVDFSSTAAQMWGPYCLYMRSYAHPSRRIEFNNIDNILMAQCLLYTHGQYYALTQNY